MSTKTKKPTPSREEWIARYVAKFRCFFSECDDQTAREHAEWTLKTINENLAECPEDWAADDVSTLHD